MWQNVKFNIQNIEAETAKAVLIKCPKNSRFDGFTFWISKKLVRSGSHSYEKTFGVKDDMTFQLKRTSPKTFKVLQTLEATADEIIEAFEGRS